MKKKIFYIALFTILMAFLFLPIAQKYVFKFKMKPLNGETVKTEKPKLTFDTYSSSKYQENLEKYISENYGFREPTIRFYNQYLWDFYRKTYSNEVAVGKNDWLYFTWSVNEFYGKEMFRWCDSNEAAVAKFNREVKVLSKLKGVLKCYDIDLLLFITPEKSYVYDDNLPKRESDTNTIHAYDYYVKALAEAGIPCFDMQSWLEKVQDTIDFPVIPQASAHWVFPAVYAADSLFHLMADLKDIEMPQIKIGKRRELDQETKNVIHDLEYLLNLMRPIKPDSYDYADREVTVVADSNSLKTNSVFIGNSYFRAFNQYIPLDEIFSDLRYWFYNMTEFYGPKLQKSRPIEEVDYLKSILNADYIAFFTNPAQMYKVSYGFAETALIKLCVSDNLWNAEVTNYAKEHNCSIKEADQYLRYYPLTIKALDTDGVPTIRNERGIAVAQAMNMIERDKEWYEKIKFQSSLQNKPIDRILKTEAFNIVDGNPLMRDNTIMNDSIMFQLEVQKYIDEFKKSPEKMEMLKKKAQERNISVEEMMNLDAIWLTEHNEKNKYGIQ